MQRFTKAHYLSYDEHLINVDRDDNDDWIINKKA